MVAAGIALAIMLQKYQVVLLRTLIIYQIIIYQIPDS
jgi:hypothetical protein